MFDVISFQLKHGLFPDVWRHFIVDLALAVCCILLQLWHWLFLHVCYLFSLQLRHWLFPGVRHWLFPGVLRQFVAAVALAVSWCFMSIRRSCCTGCFLVFYVNSTQLLHWLCPGVLRQFDAVVALAVSWCFTSIRRSCCTGCVLVFYVNSLQLFHGLFPGVLRQFVAGVALAVSCFK